MDHSCVPEEERVWLLPAPNLLRDSTNSSDYTQDEVTTETLAAAAVSSALSILLFSGFVSVWEDLPTPTKQTCCLVTLYT